MEEPVKVLYFVDRMLMGGIQRLVLNWCRKFNRKKIIIDFLLLDDGVDYPAENELKKYGCNVYKLKGVWLNSPLDFFKEAKAVKNFFEKHNDYKVIHLHSSCKNFLIMKYAKIYGIPIRIAHSHNIDFQTKNLFKKCLGNLLKFSLKKYSTHYFACSKDAAQWLFGKNIFSHPNFKVIHNAIDYDTFKYNDEIRKKIRNELNLRDEHIVIGNVSRFSRQKNHKYLLKVFFECYKLNPNYRLMLIGDGKLKKNIFNKVKEMGLEEKIIFVGYKDDINRYLNAFDLFVFPSIYEGLGLALIEAQANGLKCYTSKGVVPEEAKVSDNIEFISLKTNVLEWRDKIINGEIKRMNNYETIKSNNYLDYEIVKILEKVYIEG